MLDSDDVSDNYMEISKYCKASDGTSLTPNADFGCKPCRVEQDCGNGVKGDLSKMPNKNINWCVTPIDVNCLADSSVTTEKPTFKFRISPRDTNPTSAKYRMQVALWKKLPLWAANRIGPVIARGLG